jgi:hypothetical protein
LRFSLETHSSLGARAARDSLTRLEEPVEIGFLDQSDVRLVKYKVPESFWEEAKEEDERSTEECDNDEVGATRLPFGFGHA